MQNDFKERQERLLRAAKEAKESGMEAMMLEFVEHDDGKLVLRTSEDTEAPLVSIEFSDKVKDLLGADTKFIGQHMIHAAIQSLMHKQLSQWHANVYDEEPAHFS